MQKQIIFIIILLSIQYSEGKKPLWHQLENYTFKQYVQDFNKTYNSPQEFKESQQTFENNLIEIQTHNADLTKSWRKGVNIHTDKTPSQLKNINGYNKALQGAFDKPFNKAFLEKEDYSIIKDLPKNVDWRTKGVLSPVKNQESCGSCWAFTTTSQIESYVALAGGELKVLAPQQLVDCAKNPLQCGGQGGCHGAVVQVAMNYIELYGMVSESSYPYAGKDQTCSYNGKPEVIIDGYHKLPSNRYVDVMKHLANVGPLAINVYASEFKDYESGVFQGCDYKTNIDINHAVQLVGYGEQDGQKYWIIRNSWGNTYGEEGFIRVQREDYTECGYDKDDGTLCKGQGTTQGVVCGRCGILFDASYPLGARQL